MQRFEDFKLTGPIQIQRLEKVPSLTHCIFIVGPTGAGKSTLIESIAGDRSLGISKDQLEGFTQEIVSYKLKNVKPQWKRGWFVPLDVVLVDTPGFSDDKISEMKIIKMIHEWRQKNGASVDHILYLDRITDTRMSGSKKRILNLFKVLTGERSANCVTIATTMWDNLWNERQRMKAEEAYKEMREHHWQDFIKKGAVVAKFENTQDSGLRILDLCMREVLGLDRFNIANGTDVAHAPYAIILYQNLLARATAVTERLQLLDEDLDQESTRNNELLTQQLRAERSEVEAFLEILHQEIKDFGPPPPGMALDPNLVSGNGQLCDGNTSLNTLPGNSSPKVGRPGMFRRVVNRISRTESSPP